MTKENKRSLKSSLKKTSKITTSVKNTKFEKSYIATKKFANVKKTIINYLTNADSNTKKAEKLKFQGNECKQKAVADPLYLFDYNRHKRRFEKRNFKYYKKHFCRNYE